MPPDGACSNAPPSRTRLLLKRFLRVRTGKYLAALTLPCSIDLHVPSSGCLHALVEGGLWALGLS